AIDILVNAVGGSTIIPQPGRVLEELSFEEWQKVIAFNLDGTFLFTHAVVPIMKRQKRGKIVNLASIAGRGLSLSSSSADATVTGGIIALTRKLSLELGPFGITVNAIAPSLTLTERIRPHWNQRSPEAQQAEIERTPLKRVAEAPDQAKVICFLASSDADFVTGLTIDVTGGLSSPRSGARPRAPADPPRPRPPPLPRPAPPAPRPPPRRSGSTGSRWHPAFSCRRIPPTTASTTSRRTDTSSITARAPAAVRR